MSRILSSSALLTVKWIEQMKPFKLKAFSSTAAKAATKNILVDRQGAKNNVGLITLNRPKALNALCDPVMIEVANALTEFQDDQTIGAIVITGSEKAFAAGADIKELSANRFPGVYKSNFLSHWNAVALCRIPIIAAVNGYALGGGCELAMMCDIIYAGTNAKFGQPEINLGIIPGAGGTQRLVRSVGKSRAMEMCLSGLPISAEEDQQIGLVSRVFQPDKVLPEAIKLAEKIASQSRLISMICKEAVNTAYETSLREGLHFEARLFQSAFATEDSKEGTTAFVEKRTPKFKNE